MPTDDNANGGDTSQDTTSPKTVTVDEVSEMVNKAITNRNKGLEKQVSSLLEEFSKKFEERLSAVATAPAKDTGNEPRIEDHPIYKGMQKKFAELQERFEQSEKEKSAERQKARDMELRQRVSDELVKTGLDPNRTRHALALLESEKRFGYDDDGNVVFRDADGSELDLSTGVRSWSKGEDAKVFMPPRGATGSGDKKSTTRQSSNTNNTVSMEELGNGLLDVLNKL